MFVTSLVHNYSQHIPVISATEMFVVMPPNYITEVLILHALLLSRIADAKP